MPSFLPLQLPSLPTLPPAPAAPKGGSKAASGGKKPSWMEKRDSASEQSPSQPSKLHSVAVTSPRSQSKRVPDSESQGTPNDTETPDNDTLSSSGPTSPEVGPNTTQTDATTTATLAPPPPTSPSPLTPPPVPQRMEHHPPPPLAHTSSSGNLNARSPTNPAKVALTSKPSFLVCSPFFIVNQLLFQCPLAHFV